MRQIHRFEAGHCGSAGGKTEESAAGEAATTCGISRRMHGQDSLGQGWAGQGAAMCTGELREAGCYGC